MKNTAAKSSAAAKNVPLAMQELLKHTYTSFLLTHNYHWNVEGPNFASLHGLFEQQYNELFAAIDEIAERIRALDSYALPASSEYAGIATDLAREGTAFKSLGKGGAVAADHMLNNLVKINTHAIDAAQEVKELAEKRGDDETVDLMVGRITAHQKAVWMLKSHLK